MKGMPELRCRKRGLYLPLSSRGANISIKFHSSKFFPQKIAYFPQKVLR